MSAEEPTVTDLRDRLNRGEIDVDEFLSQLQGLTTETEREELWATWASQGLFDGPIEQEGFTSFKNGRARQVDDDG
jgi:hypothetical protein